MSEPTFEDPLDDGDLTSEFEEVSPLETDGLESAEAADAVEAEEQPAAAALETVTTDAAAQEPARPKKPRFDTYTGMLALSLIATITACVFLALELRRYEWNVEIPPPSVVTETP